MRLIKTISEHTFHKFNNISKDLRVNRQIVISVSQSLVGLLLIPHLAWADLPEQEKTQKLHLTWKECLAIARENSPSIRTANTNVRVSELTWRSMYAGFLPTLGANFESQQHGSQFLSNRPRLLNFFSSDGSNNFRASMDMAQNIFAGFSDFGKIDLEHANRRVNEAKREAVKAQLSLDLKTHFQNVRYADRALELTGEIIRRRQENLRLVQLRFSSGLENKGSLLLSEANLEQARFDQLQARHVRWSAVAGLRRVLGMDDTGQEIELIDDVPAQAPPASKPDFEVLAKETPEYVESVANQAKEEAGVRIARANFFPNMRLEGSYAHFGTTIPMRENEWSIALRMSWSLFNGGRDFYNWRTSQAKVVLAQQNRVLADRQAVLALNQTYTAFVEAVQLVKVNIRFREAAQMRAEIARKKYNNGLMTFDEWDVIENDLIGRQKSAIQAEKDRGIAEAKWEQAQGKGAL